MDTLPIIIDSHIVNTQVDVSSLEVPPLFTFLYGRRKGLFYLVFVEVDVVIVVVVIVFGS